MQTFSTLGFGVELRGGVQGPGQWTDTRVETLRRLWSDGLSASQVAKQLGGVTRNAVIGKVHRLGLAKRDRDHGSNIKKGVRKTPRPAKVARVCAPPLVESPVIDITPGVIPTTAKPLIDRSRFECAWPVAGEGMATLACAAPAVPGKPYCPCHQRMAYVPVQRKNAKLSAEWGRDAGSPRDADFGSAWAA